MWLLQNIVHVLWNKLKSWLWCNKSVEFLKKWLFVHFFCSFSHLPDSTIWSTTLTQPEKLFKQFVPIKLNLNVEETNLYRGTNYQFLNGKIEWCGWGASPFKFPVHTVQVCCSETGNVLRGVEQWACMGVNG